MGISCCLDSSFANDNELKIVVSGRYYTKLEQHTQLEVIIEEQEAFEAFFRKNAAMFNEWFELKGDKLSLRRTIPQAQLKTYKESLRALNIQITKILMGVLIRFSIIQLSRNSIDFLVLTKNDYSRIFLH